VYSAVNPEVLGVIFATSPDQQVHINGLELAPDRMIVFRRGSEGYNRSSRACQWGAIALTHDDVAAPEGPSSDASCSHRPSPMLSNRRRFFCRSC